MAFDLYCPACGTTLAADESEIGEVINCLACDSQVFVEIQEESPAPSTALSVKIRPELIPISTTNPTISCVLVGPISFSIGTRGSMKTEYDRHKLQHAHKIRLAKQRGQVSKASGLGQSISSVGIGDGDLSIALQHSGASFTSDDLDIAFQIAIGQLQLRASYLGANAVFGMRWDVDFDSNSNVLNFIGTAYGTAVTI